MYIFASQVSYCTLFSLFSRQNSDMSAINVSVDSPLYFAVNLQVVKPFQILLYPLSPA